MFSTVVVAERILNENWEWSRITSERKANKFCSTGIFEDSYLFYIIWKVSAIIPKDIIVRKGKLLGWNILIQASWKARCKISGNWLWLMEDRCKELHLFCWNCTWHKWEWKKKVPRSIHLYHLSFNPSSCCRVLPILFVLLLLFILVLFYT